MHSFTAHRLRFVAEVRTPVLLNEHQGSALRGALFHALRNQFCVNKTVTSCQVCMLHTGCPVSFLLATVDEQSARGADVPRPYTIEPPIGGQTFFQPGQTLEFGLTLFSRARDLFPYLIVAAQRLGDEGLGKRLPDDKGTYRRGTLHVREVWAENPLTNEKATLLRTGQAVVRMPDLPITHEQVLAAARAFFPPEVGDRGIRSITVHFQTPLRLIEQRELVRRPEFRILMQRLFERLSALARTYSDTPLELDFGALLAQAARVRLADDRTRWVELESYSTRLGRATPLGGLVGQATYEGDLASFLPYIIWGQFTHVGKDAVKGNGVYQLSSEHIRYQWSDAAYSLWPLER